MPRKLIACLLMITVGAAMAAEEESFRLTEFWAGDATIRLAGVDGSTTLSIPLSPIAEVSSATLRLEGSSSIALLARSQLGVRFNNATIGQLRLSSEQPDFALDVAIPRELWRPGFNSLELFVAQHAVDTCEDPNLPELWSEVDLYQSTLSVETESRFQGRLKDLNGLFHPGIGSETSVLLLTGAAETDGAVFQDALPSVAQALALRRQYRTLAIQYDVASVTESSFPELYLAGAEDKTPIDPVTGSAYLGERGGFHVLIGTRTTLTGLLPTGFFAAESGPAWRMDSTPALVDAEDRLRIAASKRLIVTGDTEEEVAEAARALNLTYDPLNDDGSIELVKVTTPEARTRLPAVGGLVPGEEYSFLQLGVNSQRIRGAGLFQQPVSVILPPDYYVAENENAYLYLDFGYGAGLGPGSALNVTVNGEAIGGVPFEVPSGQAFRRYRLTVPARLLKGGRNDINVEVALRAPLSDKPCSRVDSDHLLAHLRSSSSIALPSAGSLAPQPDLQLFGNTGYPFSVPQEATETYLTVTDTQLAGAALTLAGKLAQQAGVPLLHLRLKLGEGTPQAGTTAIFATARTLDSQLFADLEAAITATKRLPYRIQNIAYNRLARLLYGKGQRPLKVDGTLVQGSELGKVAILYAARNPAPGAEGTLLLFTAETTAVLEQRVEDLVDAALWGQLAGDFFAWSEADEAELAMKVSANYPLADEDDRMLSMRLWLTNNPWYWLTAVLLLVLLLSYLIYRALLRRNAKLSQDWE